MGYRTFSLYFVMLAAPSTISGCTLLGAGVGASVDAVVVGPFERDPSRDVLRIERGEYVELTLRNTRKVRGRYLGSHGPTPRDPERYLMIDAAERTENVAASEVDVVGVEVSGKGWLYGGLIGLGVDVAVIVVAAIALSDSSLGSPGAYGGQSGCGWGC